MSVRVRDFHARIQELMDERGWTLNKLARMSGVNQKTLDQMMKRKTLPRLDNLQDICDGFGITMGAFFKDDNETEDIKMRYVDVELQKRASMLEDHVKVYIINIMDEMIGKQNIE